jgi:hypothetical protein
MALASILHNRSASYDILVIHRYPVRPMHANQLELGEDAGCQVLEYPADYQLRMGNCLYVYVQNLERSLLIIPAIYIATDLALSLMPIRLIRTLNRSTSEKILIFTLMALGLLATGIACAKMTTFTTFGKGDPMQGTILPSLWAKLEEQVGIIASSLPCLKNPIERLLNSTGILKEHQLKRPSFVADLSLPAVPKDSDEQDSAVGSLIKEDIRVDSAAVASTSNVNISAQEHRSKTLQAV